MKKHSEFGLFLYGLLTLITFIGAFILVNDNIIYKQPEIIYPEDLGANLIIPNVIGFSDNDLVTKENEKIDFVARYHFPKLHRFNEADSEKYINNLQMSKRIAALNIDIEEVLLPEKRWKMLYNESLVSLPIENTVIFEGEKTSELNEFIKNNIGKNIKINKNELIVDETIIMNNNILLEGNETLLKVEDKEKIDYILDAKGIKDFSITGFIIDDANHGFNIKNCNNGIIAENEFYNCSARPLVINGGSHLNISNNKFNNNISGLYVMGGAEHMIIQSNHIVGCHGSANALAGMVLDSSNYYDEEISDRKKGIAERLNAPHDIVIYGNYISENQSSGVYLVGPYYIYFINNELKSNEKEGICLDWGTIACYIAENNISYNGFRMHQSDEDLKMDFIDGFGRLEDGSSPAKLPGLSMDNAMWNIIANNNIENNAGSGIKSVRTSIENIIFQNNIYDNNLGASDQFHFFGIELGAALDSDEATKLEKKMDITSNYGNIIARNNINGEHYAGIFLAEECFINDIFDNTIIGPTNWSMECLSNRKNSTVNNYSTTTSRGITLSSKDHIALPDAVD